VPDPVAFPDGMKAVADYVHSKGFKFGICACDTALSTVTVDRHCRPSLSTLTVDGRCDCVLMWRLRCRHGSWQPDVCGATGERRPRDD
jgi:hypothetical protein